MTPDGRLLAACVRRAEAARASPLARQNLTWCPDEELVYERFNDDFGPLDMGQTWHFCERVSALLARAARTSPNKRVFLFSRSDPQSRANFAVLVGAYLILCCGAAADSAFSQVQPLQPFAPFRDAASAPSLFTLSVLDCLRGLQRGRDVGHLEGFAASITARVGGEHRGELQGEKREIAASGPGGEGELAETAPLAAPTKVLAQGHGPARHPPFDVKEYEHWARLENGDMHWIIPRQFLAFSGPQNRSTAGLSGFGLTPEDYLNYFGRHGVRAVVRLNAKAYEASRFESRGIRVHELYFQDGSCPPPKIVRRFLEVAEAEEGALAVHCKAGLGRTGVLISLYNMKHFSFTAREALGYIRLCRPGSVIGPQQNFLCDMESRMWADGRAWRAQNFPVRSALGKTTALTPERELLPNTENRSEGRCPVSAYALAGRPGRLTARTASASPPSLSSLTILQKQAGSPSPRKTANSSPSPSRSPRRGAAFPSRAAAPSLLSRVVSETPASPSPRKKAAAVNHQRQQSPQLPPHSKMSQYLETSHAMGAAFHKVT